MKNKNTYKIKAVIFDLDGTITRPYLDFDLIRKEISLAPDAGPILEAMQRMSPEQILAAEKILYKHEQLAIEHSTLNPGAQEALEKLRQMKIHIGILTRNTHSNASAVAKKHSLDFDIILDRHAGPPKPDPFGVQHLCKHFNVSPAQMLLVGDYLFDLQSATAAGAIAVLMLTGQNKKFEKFANYTIDNLTQIIDIIKSDFNN